jgi:hypothetical protein
LIDNGFVIEDIKIIMTFCKNNGFKGFKSLLQHTFLEKNKGLGNFYKLCLNSSYGQEIINEEKTTKIMLYTTHQELNNHFIHTFMSTVKCNNGVYQCELAETTFCGNTIIQYGIFTLDKVKY